MPDLSAVVFDLDNTLIDRDGAVAAWLATLMPPARVAACLRQDGEGSSARAAFFAAVGKACGQPARRLRARFRAELPRHVRARAGATGLLARLAPTHRLAIASNGGAGLQRAKLAAARLGVDFAVVAISQELGVEKPAPAFFAHVLAVLGCAAHQALMVGDHPLNDIAGAAAVGMRTCWLRTPRHAPPERADACVDRLDQVLRA